MLSNKLWGVKGRVRGLAAVVALFTLLLSTSYAASGTTEAVIVSGDERTIAYGSIGGTDLSWDGRYAVFVSNTPNLVPQDTNGQNDMDVFVRDRLKGTTELINVNNTGNQMNGNRPEGTTSDDGRFVTFQSSGDVFVRDRDADGNGSFDGPGATTFVSVGYDGSDPQMESLDAQISGNGRFVTFRSAAENLVPGGHIPRRRPMRTAQSGVMRKANVLNG